ncbi:sterol desaturase family protein [Mucilaginibacter ginsenosidivorans]|uniref:Sterol desaturase family protein n=1 Tax=Mucilaginibacter ginsenosidivorans TaxID=398053 RepID=A0A5B8UVJ3_9SPHI|nr:sterol desaturase family protein [Mucilaginibacter ginsenosidivorans]QEC62755.1 sterol desaturase family protein [Mucilaginibacter ginsenosidivorans]
MNFTKKLSKNWRIAENAFFVFAFGFVMYNLATTYWHYIHGSEKSKGFISAVTMSMANHEYYVSVVFVMVIINTTLVSGEILWFITRLLKQEKGKTKGWDRYKQAFNEMSVSYKSSFLAMLIHQLLPKLVLINMFWIWAPYFQKFALFTISLTWYNWIYAYICWELSSWIFHYSCHRVRLLWCIHAPHHAPSNINMAVNWVHFFAEGYYSSFVHLLILTLLGVNPLMFIVVMAIDSAWGVFVHVSEDSLKNGQMGFLQHLVITPAHHRVHHAKNPLYIDTNFASALPIWDWIFGTLQPFKKEVKAEYGVTRELDVTNFTDLYFGEIYLLWRDVKDTGGLKNKLLYIIMPPGWTPSSTDKTAAALRECFLKTNPELGLTSRNKVLKIINNALKADKPKVEETAPVFVQNEG